MTNKNDYSVRCSDYIESLDNLNDYEQTWRISEIQHAKSFFAFIQKLPEEHYQWAINWLDEDFIDKDEELYKDCIYDKRSLVGTFSLFIKDFNLIPLDKLWDLTDFFESINKNRAAIDKIDTGKEFIESKELLVIEKTRFLEWCEKKLIDSNPNSNYKNANKDFVLNWVSEKIKELNSKDNSTDKNIEPSAPVFALFLHYMLNAKFEIGGKGNMNIEILCKKYNYTKSFKSVKNITNAVNTGNDIDPISVKNIQKVQLLLSKYQPALLLATNELYILQCEK